MSELTTLGPKPPVDFQQVFNKIPLRIFWKDRNSVFQGCNQLFATDAGLATPAEIVGLTDYDLPWRREEAEFYQKIDRQVMECDEPRQGLIECQKSHSSELVWLETSKFPLHDSNGKVAGILCCYDVVTDDMSDSWKLEHDADTRRVDKLVAEQAIQRDQLVRNISFAHKQESLRLMAGSVSHEFNNLLGAIMGMAETAKMSPPSADRSRDISERIIKTCQEAAELCSLLSMFSGNLMESTQKVDFNDLVESQHPSLARSATTPNQISLSLSKDRPASRLPLEKLRQVLMLLVQNAIEADPTSSVIIRTGKTNCSKLRLGLAKLNSTLASGDYSYIEVVDQGVGISPTDLDRIFDPFFTTKKLGRGLGLAAVCGIVSASYGAIEVESKTGEGSTFRVLLPSANTATPRKPFFGQQKPSRKPTTIMLVDDDLQYLYAMSTLLQAQKFEVVSHSGGKEAILDFGRRQPQVDIVILDVQMPEMHGVAVMEDLRRISPDVPIIFATGFVEPELRERVFQCYNTSLLEKPYSISELNSLLSSLADTQQNTSQPI